MKRSFIDQMEVLFILYTLEGNFLPKIKRTCSSHDHAHSVQKTYRYEIALFLQGIAHSKVYKGTQSEKPFFPQAADEARILLRESNFIKLLSSKLVGYPCSRMQQWYMYGILAGKLVFQSKIMFSLHFFLLTGFMKGLG